MAESILGGISQEATQQELLGEAIYMLAAILEKMPRVTGNDQCAVSIETIAANQTIGTVSTVGNMNAVGAQFVSGANQMLAGTGHIYNNIIVS